MDSYQTQVHSPVIFTSSIRHQLHLPYARRNEDREKGLWITGVTHRFRPIVMQPSQVVERHQTRGIMTTTKRPGPAWSDVKETIASLDKKELIQLIASLYRLSGRNRDFLHARFSIGDDPISPYKKVIKECMFPDVMKNKPIQISTAKKRISEYSKAVGDAKGEAELMTYFVERGNRFTVEFGDMDEGFYDALLRMYERAIKKVLSLPEEEQRGFRERLRTITVTSDGIGWGYHDGLCEQYCEAFS
jgi:hypothetical protein